MEELEENKPLLYENAMVIIKKYDLNYRSNVDKNKSHLFEQFIKANHPSFNYQF